MPLLASALPYFSTSLFFVAISLVAWRVLATSANSKRRSLLIVGYAVCLLFSFVVALAVYRLPHGWLYGILGLVLALIALNLTASDRRPVLLVSVLVFGVPILATSGFSVYRQVSDARSDQALSTLINQAMSASASSVLEQAKALAADSSLQTLPANAVGLTSLRQEALSRNVSVIMLATTDAHVKIRTDNATASGELLTNHYPWLDRVTAGESVSGIAWNEAGQLMAVAAVPSQNGMVIAGATIDSTYLKMQGHGRSLAAFDGTRLAAAQAGTAIDNQIFANAGLPGQTSTVTLSGTKSVLTSSTYQTLDPVRAYRLVTLTDE